MRRHIFLILLPMLFVLFFARTASAGVYDIFYPNPYIVEPDTTKMIYPIPVNTGNPLLDLNNKSPFYSSATRRRPSSKKSTRSSAASKASLSPSRT